MAGNIFADYGMVNEGYDASRQFDQKLSDEKEAAQLRRQAIETGNMGLEDARRNRDVAAKARTAGAASGSVTGSLSDMARVHLEAGDPVTANKYMDAAKNLQAEGLTDVTHLLLTKPDAGVRTDVADIFNAKGAQKIYANPNDPQDPKNPQFDGKGILTVTNEKTGKRENINIGQIAVMAGMVKKAEIHNIPAGGKGVILQPGQPDRIIDNAAPAKFDIKDGILFNEKTGAYQQVGQGEWKLGHITNGNQEVPVSINSKSGEVQQLGPGGTRTGMEAKIVPSTTPGGPTMIALPGGGVAEFKPATEATPGKNNWLSPNEPAKPGQPAQVVPVGQPANAPLPGAKQSDDGKWWVKQGDKWAPVIVGSPGKPQASTTAAPSPAATDAAPAPAPAAAPKPKAAEPKPKGGTRQYDEKLEKSDPQLRLLGQAARLGSSDRNVDTQLWLAYVKKAQELGSELFAQNRKNMGIGS